MSNHNENHGVNKVTTGLLLVTLGIVFGDIGTSPLYVMKAIVGESVIGEAIVLGAASCVFWTLTFQTTIKYVLLTLRADNNGEGGIFSLYALGRRYRKWLVFPAIVGGSFLLAEGIITPPISVSSAIEGLQGTYPNTPTVPIVIAIIAFLFTIQQFGTKSIGKIFGPVMLVFFMMMGIMGVNALSNNWGVLKALNPYYAFQLLVNQPEGFWLLGSILLCTTGVEALYSDMGHCGRKNIQISWIYVKTCLILNYFGQSAWLLTHSGEKLISNPYYALYPESTLIPAVILATFAAIIASQALISGSFTLISVAMRLDLWPKFKIVYPTDAKGQLYIPTINWGLLVGCVGVVLYFQESSKMEAAYGLAVTLTMLMTTMLLSVWLSLKRIPLILIILLLVIFLSIESAFLIANLLKLMHGGWVTLLIGSVLIAIMWIWHQGKKLKNAYTERVSLTPYIQILKELSNDLSVSKYSTHLIYLVASPTYENMEKRIIYSILNRQPKRADIYYFVHIDVVDEPYQMTYTIETLAPKDVIWINFKLGFRVEPRINLLFRKVIEGLVLNKEIDLGSRYESLGRHGVAGDFHFVVLESFLSYENDLPPSEKLILDVYFFLKQFSISDEAAFGLDTSSVTVEKVPLIVAPPKQVPLVREEIIIPK